MTWAVRKLLNISKKSCSEFVTKLLKSYYKFTKVACSFLQKMLALLQIKVILSKLFSNNFLFKFY